MLPVNFEPCDIGTKSREDYEGVSQQEGLSDVTQRVLILFCCCDYNHTFLNTSI